MFEGRNKLLHLIGTTCIKGQPCHTPKTDDYFFNLSPVINLVKVPKLMFYQKILEELFDDLFVWFRRGQNGQSEPS